MDFKIYDFIYERYKWFVLIPLSLVILSAAALALSYNHNGEFLKKGIEFTGGTQIRIPQSAMTREGLSDFLRRKLGEDSTFSINSLAGGGRVLWEVKTQKVLNQSSVEQLFADSGLEAKPDSNKMGSFVGQAFYHEAMVAVALAFIIMSLVVFIAFREVIPSIIVILASISDIFVTTGAMALLGIPLTFETLAALLLLIGYSVDTDVLLSFHILKNRKGSFKKRNLNAIKTGLVMTGTSIAAVGVLFLAAYFTGVSEALVQLSSVLAIGLAVDTVSTWLQNSVVFKIYMERWK